MEEGCRSSLDATRWPRGFVALVLAAAAGACNCGDDTLKQAPEPPSPPVIALEPERPVTTDDLTLRFVERSVDPQGRPVDYSIRWLRDDAAIPQITGTTVPADLTKKGETWRVEVTATNGLAAAAPVVASVVVANSPPQVEVTFDPARPTAATGIRIKPAATDADGDRVQSRFAWTRDGAATSIDGDIVAAASVTRGQTWEVAVVPNDGEADGPATKARVTVANSLPEVAGIELVPAQPTRAGSITVTPGVVTDIDGDATTLRYAWLVDGAAVPGQVASALSPVHFARGQRVSVVVTAFDGLEEGPAVVAATTVGNAAPSLSGALVSPPSGGRGTTFTCELQGWSDADGDPEQAEMEWLVDGAPAGVVRTFSTLGLTRGQEVRCRATPVNDGLRGAPVTSAPVVLSNTPPSLSEARLTPASPRAGDTLTVTPVGFSDADGDPPGFRYTWRRNGLAMPAAGVGPSASGVFTRGDRISVAVEPFDGTDTGAAVLTNEVVVGNTPPTLASVALSPSPPTKAGPIVAVTSGLRDEDGDVVTVRYEWRIGGVGVSATGSSLPVLAFARGQLVEVTAIPFDGVDEGAPATASATVANSPPSVAALTIAPVGASTVTNGVAVLATAVTADPDGDLVTIPRYEWRVATPSGTRTLVTTTATLPAGSLVHNEQVVVAVAPTDGTGTANEAVSNRLIVGNTPPTAATTRLSADAPALGDRLTCSASGATDADGQPITYAFDWRRNGAAVSTATTSGANSDLVLNAGAFAAGDRVSCAASATDGYATGPSGVAATATIAGCGDGRIAPPEQCDDGNSSDVDACRNTCAAATCGDGVRRTDLAAGQPGHEACDDGNPSSADACLPSCVAARCGDGVLRTDLAAGQPGFEACDDGNGSDTDACRNACVPAACGDGVRRTDLAAGQAGYEACDDGNASDEDACLSSCAAARCGDGIARLDLAPGALGFEACDDGNASDTDACLSTCVAARCGDGRVWAGLETCDDGNTTNGDGCDATCQIERAGCQNPGTIVVNWAANPPPVLTATNANWAIRTGQANSGPNDAVGKRVLTSNPPPEFGAGRNDSVRLPTMDFSAFAGCTVTVSFPVWTDLRTGYDGANLQATDDATPSSASTWTVVSGSSMGYDRSALSTSSCATCFMAGQPVWSRVSGVTTASSTARGLLTAYAGKRNVTLRFAFHSDALGTTTLYNGVFVGNMTIEAK